MSQHILIVEDDVMIQGFLTLTLEQEGYRTTAVGSGGGMFSVLEHETVDLIIMDLGLPDADGLDLTKEIRKTSTMPIIVASARRNTEDRLSALEFGANDYLTKPFDPRELVLRVRNHLAIAVEAAQTPAPAAASRDRRQPAATAAPSDRRQPAAAPRDRRQAAQSERRGQPARSSPQPQSAPAEAPAAASAITPATTPARTPAQPTSSSDSLIGIDNTMMVLGGLVIAGVLAGGAFWYYGQVSDDDAASMEQAAVDPKSEAERRGALQPPPEQPVRLARPPDSETTTPPSTPDSLPKPYTPSLTESVTAKPSASIPSAPKPGAKLSPSVSGTSPAVPKNWVKASKCPQIPDLAWWRVKSHEQIVQYVSRKYDGNWLPYIESWEKRLEKMQDIFQRGSAIKTGTGVMLRGVALADYVNDMARRVAVTKCLAKEAKLNGQ